MAAKCASHGNIKVYNVEAYNEESRPGLVRREEPDGAGHPGKIIEVVTVEKAHNSFGCMSWQDIDELLHRLSLEVDQYRMDIGK